MGQKFASYNAQGAITGYYDSVDSPVPAGVTAIEISVSQWQACLAGGNGYAVVNGALVAPAAPTALDLLAAAQASQTTLVSNACANAITSGFNSSALGATYTYPSQPADQANLSASVLAALLAQGSAVTYVPGMQATAGMIVSAGGQLYSCSVAGPTGTTEPVWPTATGQLANDGGARWELWTTPFWCESEAGVWAFVNHTAPQIMAVGQAGKQAILANMAINVSLAAQIAEAENVAAVRAIAWP